MCILIIFELGGEIKPSAELSHFKYNFCLVIFFSQKLESARGAFPKSIFS